MRGGGMDFIKDGCLLLFFEEQCPPSPSLSPSLPKSLCLEITERETNWSAHAQCVTSSLVAQVTTSHNFGTTS